LSDIFIPRSDPLALWRYFATQFKAVTFEAQYKFSNGYSIVFQEMVHGFQEIDETNL